jgi:hypothetical protein
MGGWEGASPSDTLNGLKAVNPVESYAARDEKVLSVRSLVALSQPFSLLLCTFVWFGQVLKVTEELAMLVLVLE